MPALKVAVDGYGLTRPRAGMGTYTREILAAMERARPDHDLEILDQPGVRLLGRHLLYPLAVRRRHPGAFFAPAGHVSLLATGVPEIVTVHDLAIYRHPEWFPPGQPLATRIVVPRSLRRAAALIAVSESTARDVSDLFGVDRSLITVVHHGVAPRFQPHAGVWQDLPAGYVLFVSTIEPRKNLQTLLDAWASLEPRPPLVVAGGWGWRHEEIRARMASAPPGLTHLGEVAPEDLPSLYSGAACLAHPAWYEGFGLTVLEAMACGTPVVASDTSSLPEVGGDAVLYAAPDDPAAWRAALQRVLADPGLAADLGRRGLERAGGFTWERAAEQTWAVVESAAGGGAAA